MMEAGLSARRVARQLGRSDWCCEEVFGPVDLRYVINTKTRLKTPSTDQSPKRLPHREPVISRTIRRRLDEGHLGSRRPLRELPLTPTHRSLLLKWCRAQGNWTAAEWN
ncbi:uncharacterized protein TNCV_2371631 [Trichonephila clavipes]|nr:uncharacterized protein TNCV_2371631 [Trichonephila clavipes]